MVDLQIHSELNVYNFVRMRSDLAFLLYVIPGVTFFRTQCILAESLCESVVIMIVIMLMKFSRLRG